MDKVPFVDLKAQHASIGIVVTPVTSQLSRLFKLPVSTGLLVQGVEKASGAAKAGLKVGTTKVIVGGVSYWIGGDIIVGLDGRPTTTFEQLRDGVSRHKPGDTVKLELYRGGSKKTVTVTLGQEHR